MSQTLTRYTLSASPSFPLTSALPPPQPPQRRPSHSAASPPSRPFLSVSDFQVRSVTYDVKVWEPAVLDLFQALGNSYCNFVWEELLPQHRDLMDEPSLLNKMMLNLRSTCKYYTGYPKDLGPPKVLHFTSEREFVQLLHQGHPVVVAFTIKCNLTKRLDKVLEEAAAEFDPHVKFLRVECPKYPGFCITRQKTEYPFIEIFHNPEQAANEGKGVDPNITKYAVRVLPFHFDVSVYGFREFFKRHGIKSSDPSE